MTLLRRCRALLRRRQTEADRAEEMRFHLDERTLRNVAAGLPPDEARQAARRRFGNVTSIQETARAQRGFVGLEGLVRDLRLAARSLRRSPGFTTVALLTLALGIGVNTASFSVLDALLLHRVPYPHPEELVRVYRTSGEARRGPHAPANFLDYQADNGVFERMAAFRSASFNLAEPGEPADRLQGMLVSGDFFPLLGVPPALGRVFAPADDRPGADAVVVISDATWRRRFGGSPSALGRRLRIDGQPVTIIGVMPAAFADEALWGDVAVWRPLALSEAARADRDNAMLSAVARLRPGLALGRAQAAMDLLAARLAAAHPRFNAGVGVRLMSLAGTIQDDMGLDITWLTMGLAGFVLLIACANLANLQLARHLGRGRELAIRAALGASRVALLRRVLGESLLLALGGGALSCLVALATSGVVSGHVLPGAPLEIPLDLRVLGFALTVSVLTGIAFGLLPGWLASRADVADTLKRTGRAVTAGRLQQRLRQALVVAEIALALVLLAGAGFFLRGLERFTQRDPGWRAGGLLTARLNVRGLTPEESAAFYQRLLERLAELPGVERAAISSAPPTWSFINDNSFVVEGRPPPPPDRVPEAATAAVTPGYFQTLGLRLLQGRDFTRDDRRGSPAVVIINESMARKLWPGESPLGKRIGGATPYLSNPREIVGVVSDARPMAGLGEVDGRFQMYRALAQRPEAVTTIALRGHATPEALARDLRRIVAALDLDQSVYDVGTTEQALRRSLAPLDAAAWTLAGFALLGLLLAAIGIYGVIATFVGQRTAEIGIRMTLGAQVSDVLRLVLGQGLHLTLLGLGLGLGGAFAVARLLASIMPALPAAEPGTAAGVALVLVVVTVLSSWLPARRAAKIDPMVALRCE